MTIKTALNLATQKLTTTNINSASLDAEVLLAHVLNKPKEYIFTYPEKILSPWLTRRYFKLIKKRLNNVPVAYLIGKKEFYGYNFKVKPGVLIPRPLTEELVNNALNFVKSQSIEKKITIAELGTGSGNIIISLALELKKINRLDSCRLIATDISNCALKIAKKNAKYHQILNLIEFKKGSLLKPLKSIPVDLLLANLPYLTPSHLTEKSIQNEPKSALVGDFYPQIIKEIKNKSLNLTFIYEDLDGTHCQAYSSPNQV